MDTAIVLFRRDLRLTDNPALTAARASHRNILPVFIHAPAEDSSWPAGAASRWWLHHSLASLQVELHKRQTELHLRQGDSLTTLLDLTRQGDVRAVYWNRQYEPATIEHDCRKKAALQQRGIEAHSFSASLWSEPWQLATQKGEPYRVFTPYWRNLRAQLQVTVPFAAPDASGWKKVPGSLSVSDLRLLPDIRWDRGLADTWEPGEPGALNMLKSLCDDIIIDYAQSRDRPDLRGTSRLSPHLHFGEISSRQIYYALHLRQQDQFAKRRIDIEPYLRQLGWREFAHHLLYHFPDTSTENFNPRFNTFKWASTDKALLESWQRGCTGIPLVDAGMRELWHSGWMHNRVRMIVASFLTKNLRQHWHHGARWFWDTLVDADLANNTLGWQWVAGCGADAAPYFRVFNPVTQARKFDPDGRYLKRWLPELAKLPSDLLYEPWKDPAVLTRSGYPAPIVDLDRSRQTALAAYQDTQQP